MPKGMPNAVHKGDRDVIGVLGTQVRVGIDVHLGPGVTGPGANCVHDRNGQITEVTAVTNQNHYPGLIHC